LLLARAPARARYGWLSARWPGRMRWITQVWPLGSGNAHWCAPRLSGGWLLPPGQDVKGGRSAGGVRCVWSVTPSGSAWPAAALAGREWRLRPAAAREMARQAAQHRHDRGRHSAIPAGGNAHNDESGASAQSALAEADPVQNILSAAALSLQGCTRRADCW